MDQLSFAQQLIDDFDMEQLDIAMAPLVKQESGELATCSMAAHTGTIIQPAGTGSNSSSSSSSFMSCQPESSAPPDPSSSTTTTQQPVAVKEEFVGLDACQSKWTEASCDLKSMNFLEMCAAEILCPEAGVLGRPFADKVLTECMKSVASSEAVLSMTTLARDAAYSNSSEVLSPEASLSAEAVLSPVQALSPEALSNDAFSPDAFSPDVLSPVSENSRGGWSCSSMMMDRSDSEDASGSENSSDTVLFENSQSCSTPGGEFGLETPPDTPPDTPTPQPEEVANRRSFRGRGSAARGASASTPVDLTDQDLIHLPVRELNKRLQGCPKDQVSHLKQKRRTLKNRGYAQNCRSKRMTQKQELESTNHSLHQEIDRLKRQLASASRERDHYKRRCDILQNAVVKNCPRSGGGDQSQNGAKPPQPSGSNFQTDAAGKRL